MIVEVILHLPVFPSGNICWKLNQDLT